MKSYEDIVCFMEAFNCAIILMGDINIDITQILTLSGDKKQYCQINSIHGMIQINTNEYTRITNVTSTLVDHMVTNCPDKVSLSGVIHNGLSDHSMSFLVWKIHYNISNYNPRYITYRKSKGVDMMAFITDLESQNWTNVEKCGTMISH